MSVGSERVMVWEEMRLIPSSSPFQFFSSPLEITKVDSTRHRMENRIRYILSSASHSSCLVCTVINNDSHGTRLLCFTFIFIMEKPRSLKTRASSVG